MNYLRGLVGLARESPAFGFIFVVTLLPHCRQRYVSVACAAGTSQRQPHDWHKIVDPSSHSL